MKILNYIRFVLTSLLLFNTVFVFSQYPAIGSKLRLGYQTTGDGLVYRGAIGDTTTLDPSGINNAWMLLDTASGNLYAYRAKAWRLVSGGGGGGGLTMPFDSVTFNVNETDASLRELKYSEEKGYLQYGGQDSVQIPLLPGIWYVRNDTSVTIPKGTVLRATGTLGASGRIKVKHMIANGSIDAMYILGIAMQDIAVGVDGYAMSQGKIRKINTQAYSEGAVLYADVDTLGGLTQTEPTGSNLKLPIAFVVNSASNGTIAVRVTSGAYMRDLHDTYITSPDSSASLYYNKSEGIWRDTGAAVLVADTSAMLSSYISNADTSVFARDFQISGTGDYIAKFTGSNTVRDANIKEVVGNPSSEYVLRLGTNSDANQLAYLGNRLILGRTNSDAYNYYADNPNNEHPNLAIVSSVNDDTLILVGRKAGASINKARFFVRNSTNDAIVLGVASDSATTFHVSQPNSGSGNVGIATSSPSRPLHVAGTTAIRIPVGNFAQRGTSDNGDIRVRTDTASMEYYSGAWRTVAPMARVPQSGLANRFSKFNADGLLDTSAVLTQSNGRIGINATPTEQLQVGGTVRATRYIVNTSTNVYGVQTFNINNYSADSSLGQNIFIGTTGLSNVYQGFILDGSFNTSVGVSALNANTTGYGNTALGRNTLSKNTKGSQNTAVGLSSLTENTLGDLNTGVGGSTLGLNTTGNSNTAVGASSLSKMISGSSNTGVGQSTITNNTTGSNNTAVGLNALDNLTTTSNNTAVGYLAGSYAGSGTTANQTSSNSTYVGYQARAGASGNIGEIVIGVDAVGNGNNTVTIGGSSTTATILPAGSLSVSTTSTTNKMNINGNAVIGSSYIGTAAPADGLLVVGNVGIGASSVDYKLHCAGVGYFGTGLRVDYTAAFDANTIFQMPNTSTKAAKGYAWNTYSDARIKSNFDTIQNALQAVQALKPVYYDQHDSEVIDGKIKLQDGKTRTVGFIAQDVAPVIPAAVQAGNDTQLWGMDYTKLIPYLTKAIQEQQAQIEALKKEIEALKNK